VSKKTKKPEKPGKNNRKNLTVKKNQLNRLKFWKNRPVRFGFSFISLKSKNRTEPKPKKPSQIGKKPSQLVWTGFCPKKPNRNRSFWTSFGFFKKKIDLIIFFIKTESNQEWPLLVQTYDGTWISIKNSKENTFMYM
jgi:hypothetical protein